MSETQNYKGILIRDNYMDRYIVDEMEGEYQYLLSKCKDQVVLDIGANVGAFSHRAYEFGAKTVISIEPEQDNFKLLVSNMEAFDSSITINAAVTLTDGDEITLYVNEGNNKGLHTIMPNWLASNRPDHTEQIVETVSIQRMLHFYKPSVLKIDIEGGEVMIAQILRNLPDFVQHVAIEFDTISDTYLDTIKALLKGFKDGQRNKFFTGSRR